MEDFKSAFFREYRSDYDAVCVKELSQNFSSIGQDLEPPQRNRILYMEK